MIVWAGMRGAVTVAAAQTLPETAPTRSSLVLVAFVVAIASLVVQGGTLAALIRAVKPAQPDPEAVAAERERIRALLEDVAVTASGDGEVAVIEAQRSALLDVRDDGTYGASTLNAALIQLDAAQLSIELRSEREA